MSESPTTRLPRSASSDWKAWLLMAGLFITPPGISTAVLTVQLDSLRQAVGKNTDAADKNTTAINQIMLELAGRKDLGEKIKDHESRIRVLEKGGTHGQGK